MILWLPSRYIGVKFLLGVWLIVLFVKASKVPYLTLGAFLCFVGLFLIVSWYFASTVLGYVSAFLMLLWIFGKFRFIDKLTAEHDDLTEA